jgi:hypothetical protein
LLDFVPDVGPATPNGAQGIGERDVVAPDCNGFTGSGSPLTNASRARRNCSITASSSSGAEVAIESIVIAHEGLMLE